MSDSPKLQALIDRLEEEAASDPDPSETPDVGIIMGSDSDLDVMAGAHDALEDLGFEEDTGDGTEARFSYETYVVSAHRTPALMYAYGETARARGISVIIAGAGGKSADLPNMTASIAFPVPVIGVPVQEKSVDSVIGMPTGAPIVAVDAGKSYNAALSAVQVLALEHDELADRLTDQHLALQEDVAAVSQRLHDSGLGAFRDGG